MGKWPSLAGEFPAGATIAQDESLTFAPDVILSRSGANALRLFDSLAVDGTATVNGKTSLSSAGSITLNDGNNGYIALVELAADPATQGDRARLFARDNGAGKTQLCVRFPTGVAVVLATEL